MKNRSLIFILGTALLLCGFRPISTQQSGDEVIAIGGYDTVAYFTESKAIVGSPLLAVEWQGAMWYFRKPKHKEMFLRNPDKYAPRYGGYCAYCVAVSEKVETDGNPEIFIVLDDKLYLLQSEDILEDWKAEPKKYSAQADQIYDSLLALNTKP